MKLFLCSALSVLTALTALTASAADAPRRAAAGATPFAATTSSALSLDSMQPWLDVLPHVASTQAAVMQAAVDMPACKNCHGLNVRTQSAPAAHGAIGAYVASL